MEAQKQSPHRSRKLHRAMIVLAIISTLAAIVPFVIGCSFFVAVELNLEGLFRLKVFWFPMPQWLLQAFIVIALGNFVLMFVFGIPFILQLLKSSKASYSQEQGAAPSSPRRWQLIWYCSVIILSILSSYFFGGEASSFVSKGKTELVGIAMVSSTEGWAAGNVMREQPEGSPYGVIWHYSDGRWTQVAQLADDFLSGIAALPDGEAWVVGDDNLILHEQRGIWTSIHSGLPAEDSEGLSNVAMVSSTEGWAIGYSFSDHGPRGFIWHYSHNKWTESFQLAKASLWNISALPDGEAWAVGNDGVILHEQGGNWSQVASPTQQELDSIAMVSPTEGWAIGGRTLLHYHNSTWTLFPIASNDDLHSITMASSSEGWMVATNGDILHYTQGIWQQAHSPTSQFLEDIALVPGTSSAGWIVGEGPISDTNTIPAPTILRMQNDIWSAYQS
jgi:hypothetical protein